MDTIRKNGAQSNILRVTIKNATTGLGMTGLTSASAGLTISTIADKEASATVYTSGGSTVEGITTLGTYAAPTATKCRFKEVDATNHAGLYELQFADARFAVSGAQELRINISGVTGIFPAEYVVQLTAFDFMVAGSAAWDSILIESGITPSADLVNDASTQLSSINARQAMSLAISALAAVLSGVGSGTIAIQAAGNPAVQRIGATVDSTGRLTVGLAVPT